MNIKNPHIIVDKLSTDTVIPLIEDNMISTPCATIDELVEQEELCDRCGADYVLIEFSYYPRPSTEMRVYGVFVTTNFIEHLNSPEGLREFAKETGRKLNG